MTEQKIIVPLPPRYIVDKLRCGPLELSWTGVHGGFDQTKILSGSALALAGLSSVTGGYAWLASGIAGAAGIYLYAKYAWTHEKLIESKLHVKHRIREYRGRNHYSSVSSDSEHISKLYNYTVTDILPGGIIDFGRQKYGIILKCDAKFLSDDELKTNIAKVGGFFNSIQPKVLVKVRTKSQIPYLNPVEKMTMKQLSHKNPANEEALLYSMHSMSAKAPKAVDWSQEIGIFFNSNPDAVHAFVDTILPGIQDRLGAASIHTNIVKQPDQIYNVFANEISTQKVSNNRIPALFGTNSRWSNMIRQIMPGSIIEYKDHLLLNHKDYMTALLVGTPVGGVSGFSPSLSPEILMQLYRTSASNEHIIEIHQHIYPVPSPKALKNIKTAINKILVNEKALETNHVAKYDMGLDMDDLKNLYARIKDGMESMFDINYIITISSPSYASMLAGRSKVQAILGANNVQSKVPENEILQVIRSTQFLPYYDDTVAVWLPTSGLSRISPLVTGAKNPVSSSGLYYGNEVTTMQEVIIDHSKLGASHTLMIGPTRSGKTTAMSLTGIRTILNGDDCIYMTNKPDATTNYLAVAEYFKDKSQVIKLGRQLDGTVEYNINPLEIMYNDAVKFDPINMFYEHFDRVKFFLNLVTGGDRTEKQMGYIGRTLLDLYFRFGIDPANPKTWKTEKQPTLIDLYQVWENDFKEDPANVTIEAVVSRTEKFTNTLAWLSNPTNVHLSEQYTVIDLSAVREQEKQAMNYLLISILKLRFDINSKRKTTIMIDEAGVFLEDKELQREFSHYLKQAGSYGIRVIIGSQQLGDLATIGAELKANISVSEVYGLNIDKSIDDVMAFFKFSESTKKFLLSCSRAGMCALSVGYPYASTYHIQRTPSDLESQILFGKREQLTVFSFVHPALETLAREQKVILSDWIQGNTTELRQKYVCDWIQRTVGQGNTTYYLDPSIIDEQNPDILHINGGTESREHAISVLHLAGYLLERNIPTVVNHVGDADVVAQFPDGFVAFEYQTSAVGGNDPKRLMAKRENGINKYGRLFFVGNTHSIKEVAKALGGADEIVISRGKYMEKKLKELLGELDDEETKPFEAK